MIDRIDVVLRVTDDRHGETRDFVVARVVHPFFETRNTTWETQVHEAMQIHPTDLRALLEHLREERP